ncbi:hypothetical protein NQ317_009431, partial [Molorchus minor]
VEETQRAARKKIELRESVLTQLYEHNTHGHTKSRRIWNYAWLIFLMGYYFATFYTAALIVANYELVPALAAFLLLEQVRLTMKTHAFVRSNAPAVLNYKKQNGDQQYETNFSKFLYFVFAPTLVYRNDYPRTKTIRWNFVFYRLLEIVGIILCYNFILYRFLIPTYQDFGKRKFSIEEIILSFFENTLVGILLFLSTFYLILHAVQNMFAEILRFGDRLFYSDWWTCTSYSEYFRKWNIVVYDWLYTYLYKEMYEINFPKNKNLVKILVFLASALVHEWILFHMMGFFLPVLFIVFSFIAVPLTFVNLPHTTLVNILFWYTLSLGSGFIVSIYTVEYYAHLHAPIENNSNKDYFLPNREDLPQPRIWTRPPEEVEHDGDVHFPRPDSGHAHRPKTTSGRGKTLVTQCPPVRPTGSPVFENPEYDGGISKPPCPLPTLQMATNHPGQGYPIQSQFKNLGKRLLDSELSADIDKKNCDININNVPHCPYLLTSPYIDNEVIEIALTFLTYLVYVPWILISVNNRWGKQEVEKIAESRFKYA